MFGFKREAIQEVACSARELDFFLYNTRSRSSELEWVYWRRGVTAHAAANRLFAVRLLTDCEGRDLTYDFEIGEYMDPEEHPEAGWIRPEVCLDHSGGVIVRFREESAAAAAHPGGLAHHPTNGPLTLAQMLRGSDYPVRAEIRSRPTALSPWRHRIVELRLKKFEDSLPYSAPGPMAAAEVRYAGVWCLICL